MSDRDNHILALDQGTTSSRAILFDSSYSIVQQSQEELTQYFPNSGWVEHDPMEIWQTLLNTAKQALEKAKLSANHIAGIGITNQRETAIIWDRETGKPVYNAIVWHLDVAL